tara:strand:+ start:6981 stop:7361 length:381 start_codon:yes stop_codon:yes gene_type:complete
MIPLIGALLPVVSSILDKVIPDDAARAEAKEKMQSAMLTQSAEIEKAAASVVLAEANGESWLQRNWRPMIMVWFAILLGMDWFGFRPEYMTESTMANVYDLLKIGIGGYIVSRGAEKGIKVWKDKP